MTRIVYTPYRYELTVEGHAEALKTPQGKSLLCAAVSSLTYALEAHSAFHEEYRGDIKRCADTALFTARFNPPQMYCIAVREAMDTIVSGLKVLAMSYPDNITFEERGIE